MKLSYTEDGRTREVDLYTKEGLEELARVWLKASCQHRLMYEPTWLGVPIIQYPEDIVMMQELIWKLRPDVIVETGVAHGGSAILYGSVLEVLGKGHVIGIDIEIRQYNKVAIKSHPMSKRITLVEGSSVDPAVFARVRELVGGCESVLVVLDSNHSYEHVREEMRLYSQLVPADGYLVVMDGAQALMSDIPRGKAEWRQDNPLRAIEEFVAASSDWEPDPHYNRLLITSSPRGYLRRKRRPSPPAGA